MEAEFLELMPHKVKITSFIREDFHGNDIYDEANVRTYRCRIVGKGIALRRALSEDETVIFDIYLDPGTDRITTRDRIELPAELLWLDQTPEIFAVGRFTDDEGQHHVKIQCGWMYHRQGQ